MENKKRRNLIKGTLVAGALLSVTALSATPNSSNLFEYCNLGSGAEVRTEILSTVVNPFNTFEAKCGEKAKEGETKTTEAKCGEGKCGEGTCGEGDKKATTTKVDGKAAVEAKVKDAKCGEGTCGEGEKKVEAKAKKAKKVKK